MHYRLTRPEVYGQDTPGFDDRSARQGHYVTAPTAELAAKEVRGRLGIDEPLDVQFWNGGPQHGLFIDTY